MADSDVWVLKYLPKNTSEVLGQEKGLREIKEFITNFKKQKKKGLILTGPVGCGKTSSVYAVAKELDCEITEVNASDERNTDKIEQIIGSCAKQQSLFFRNKVILIDEVDGVSGQDDRGGILALVKVLEETKFPLIFTANDVWDKKFSSLRKKCNVITFNDLSFESVYSVLSNISKNENLKINDLGLKMLARRSGSDLRGAIIDLQTLSISGQIEAKDIEELGYREQTDDIKKALTKIFKFSTPSVVLDAFNTVNEDIEECMLWIDENLPKEYLDPESLNNAYNALSRADVFYGRIRRWQHWRFLVYVNSLITAGIAVSKKEKNKANINYEQTSRILSIFIQNQKNLKRNSIAEKIASHTHSSIKHVIKNDIYVYKYMYRTNALNCDTISQNLDLTEEEIEWLKK